MNWFKSTIVLVSLMSAFSLGCAHDDGAVQRSAERRIEDYRIVSQTLSKHPMASLAQRDLTRAKTWLRRAESMLHDEDRDDETFTLLLDVIEGQLIMVRSSLSRMASEKRLEQERLVYERRAVDLKSRQKATQRSKNTQSKEQPQ